jgi:phage terminase large subunit-like protein
LTCAADPVRQYAEDVVAGKLPAGKWVRLACKRHLDDLATGAARGLRWDQAAADHAIEFFGFLRHSKGRWNAQVFVLSPWQAFIVGSIFGWKRADGTRRFRIAFVEVPRKNGKTTLAAGIGLYLLACDGEAGAEVYCAATKRDQAKLVFSDMKAFVRLSPELAEWIERNAHSLEIPETRSKAEPLGADADTTDGLNPSGVICDEIHAWKSRELWDVLLTGMGAREQPLALAITTAGDFASETIYSDLHNDAEQILDGVVADDAVFAYIATPDSGLDWKSPAAWAQANPNLGVSPSRVRPRRSDSAGGPAAERAKQSQAAAAEHPHGRPRRVVAPRPVGQERGRVRPRRAGGQAGIRRARPGVDARPRGVRVGVPVGDGKGRAGLPATGLVLVSG